MHPVIRIISFLVFGAFVAYGKLPQLLFALVLIIAAYTYGHAHLLRANWRILKRMRWLFLSIFVLYLWFTPGRPLVGAWVSASPTIEGITLGALRVGSLILIVMAVNLLIKSIPRDAMVAAILFIIKPLARVGFSHEKFAIRIVLTMEAVNEVQYLQSLMPEISPNSSDRARDPAAKTPLQGLRTRLDTVGEYAALLFMRVIERAHARTDQPLTLIEISAPPMRQWVYPVLLGLSFASF